jgi:hypothetical protein
MHSSLLLSLAPSHSSPGSTAPFPHPGKSVDDVLVELLVDVVVGSTQSPWNWLISTHVAAASQHGNVAKKYLQLNWLVTEQISHSFAEPAG